LFDARRLYARFSRFVYVIDGVLKVENIVIPASVSKGHLILIARYCTTKDQENILIEKITRQSLTIAKLRLELIAGTALLKKKEPGNVILQL
jgi:hypothetical protein